MVAVHTKGAIHVSDTRFDKLSISCLGEFSLSFGSSETVRVRPKIGELIVLLLLARDTRIPRSTVAKQLWPGASEVAASDNLRTHLKLLKSALGSQHPRLLATDGTLGLNTSNAVVDQFQFQDALKKARLRGDVQVMEDALSLYRGHLLPSSSVDSIVRERIRLLEMYVKGLETLAERLILVEQRERALRVLWEAHGHDPLCERVVAVMLRLAENDPNAAKRIFSSHQTAVRNKRGQAVNVRLIQQFQQIYEAHVGMSRNAAVCDPELYVRVDKVPVSAHPLVGREHEMERIKIRLAQASLVTLTGPGGVGKTRIALEVGRECASNYRDGVVFVDLSQLNPGDTAESIAAAVQSALEVESGAVSTIEARYHILREASHAAYTG